VKRAAAPVHAAHPLITRENTMSSKLLSTLLACGALLAAAQVPADDAPAAPAAKPSNAWTDMRPLNAAAPPSSGASPAAAKGSAAMAGGSVTGTGTVTGPVTLASDGGSTGAKKPKKKKAGTSAAAKPGS
jgi:hypothetical protein